MNTDIEWTEHNCERYRALVSEALRARYGVTLEAIHADVVVSACRKAGLSPAECVAWLARVHRLAFRRPQRGPGTPKPPSP